MFIIQKNNANFRLNYLLEHAMSCSQNDPTMDKRTTTGINFPHDAVVSLFINNSYHPRKFSELSLAMFITRNTKTNALWISEATTFVVMWTSDASIGILVDGTLIVDAAFKIVSTSVGFFWRSTTSF